jgi:hypothetical protein
VVRQPFCLEMKLMELFSGELPSRPNTLLFAALSPSGIYPLSWWYLSSVVTDWFGADERYTCVRKPFYVRHDTPRGWDNHNGPRYTVKFDGDTSAEEFLMGKSRLDQSSFGYARQKHNAVQKHVRPTTRRLFSFVLMRVPVWVGCTLREVPRDQAAPFLPSNRLCH